MSTESEKARKAELAKWLVKVNPEMAKHFRETEEWWDGEERKDPANKKLKEQADQNRNANILMAKEEAKLEAPGRAKAANLIKGGDLKKTQDDLQKWKERVTLAIDHYWNNYSTALTRTQFGVDANTPEEIDNEDMDFLEALAKKTFGAVIDLAHLDGAKEVLGVIAKSLVDLTGEIKGKRPPNGKAELNSYIDGMASSVEDKREQMKLSIIKGAESVSKKYENTLGNGLIDNAKAYLESVQGNAERFAQALESYTLDRLKRQFLLGFVKTKGSGEDGRPAGTLYFRLYLDVEFDDKGKPQWGIKDRTSPAWKLVTKRGNPEGLAKTLLASLEGAKTWQIALEKRVYIDIEMIGSQAALAVVATAGGPIGGMITKSLNKHIEGMIIFNESDGNFRTHAPSQSLDWVKKAWDEPEIRAKALNTKDLVGADN